jgi:hypothetical protein
MAEMDGDQHREVNGGDSDPLDRNHQHAELPLIPVVRQDGGDHGDDLNHRFQLAQVAGLDGETFRRGDGAQPGDEKLAADDDHGDPDLDHLGVVGHQGNERAGHHDLVGNGVKQHAHGGDLLALARQVAVQPVGDRGQDKKNRSRNLLLAVRPRHGK